MRIVVEADRLLLRLKRMQTSAEKLSPVLEDIGQDMVTATKTQRFDQEKDPERRPWKKLSPGYKAYKDRVRPGAKILVFNGTLKDSIRHSVSSDAVSIGTSVEYASKHQYGEGKLPARPFLGFNSDDATKALARVKEHITK